MCLCSLSLPNSLFSRFSIKKKRIQDGPWKPIIEEKQPKTTDVWRGSLVVAGASLQGKAQDKCDDCVINIHNGGKSSGAVLRGPAI